MPHATKLGEGVASDVFYVTDARGDEENLVPVYSWIDLASTYHICVPSANETPTATEHAALLEEQWILHYGPPDFFVCDPGDEQVGTAMEQLLIFWGVKTHVKPEARRGKIQLLNVMVGP